VQSGLHLDRLGLCHIDLAAASKQSQSSFLLRSLLWQGLIVPRCGKPAASFHPSSWAESGSFAHELQSARWAQVVRSGCLLQAMLPVAVCSCLLLSVAVCCCQLLSLLVLLDTTVCLAGGSTGSTYASHLSELDVGAYDPFIVQVRWRSLVRA